MKLFAISLLFSAYAFGADYKVTDKDIDSLRTLIQAINKDAKHIMWDYGKRSVMPRSRDRDHFEEDMETNMRDLRAGLREWIQAIKKPDSE